jgi:hypothetical protein
MRFLNGLLGAFAGLMVTAMLTSALFGTFHVVGEPGYWAFHGVIALVAAGIMAWREKPEWTMARFAVAGVYTAGSVLLVVYMVTLAALAQVIHMPMSMAAVIVTILPALVSGIGAGVGYRALAGTKPAG